MVSNTCAPSWRAFVSPSPSSATGKSGSPWARVYRRVRSGSVNPSPFPSTPTCTNTRALLPSRGV